MYILIDEIKLPLISTIETKIEDLIPFNCIDKISNNFYYSDDSSIHLSIFNKKERKFYFFKSPVNSYISNVLHNFKYEKDHSLLFDRCVKDYKIKIVNENNYYYARIYFVINEDEIIDLIVQNVYDCPDFIYHIFNGSILKENAEHGIRERKIKKLISNVMTPVKYKITNDPSVLKINSKYSLFNYQFENVNWMKNIENKVSNTKIKSRNTNIYRLINSSLDKELFLDTENEYVINNNSSVNVFFQLKGGALIDEMGCGKSVSIINHTLNNILPEKKKIEFLNGKIVSKATLILVPTHIVLQWHDEILKFSYNHYKPKIVLLTSKKELCSLTYQDLANADFVISTYVFIATNKNFMKIAGTDKLKYRIILNNENKYKSILKEINEKANTTIDVIRKKSDIKDVKTPNIYGIHWNRIVYDEYHEFFGKLESAKELRYYLLSTVLKSNFKWCITGTPFPHDIFSYGIMMSMLFEIDFKSISCYHSSIYSLIDYYSKNKHIAKFLKNDMIIRRNTMNTTNIEHKVLNTTINDITIKLEFTTAENRIYNNYRNLYTENSLFLKQFCCYPQMNNALSKCYNIKDIHDEMKKINDAKLNKAKQVYESRLAKYNEYKEYYTNGIAAGFPKKELVVYKNYIQNNTGRIEELKSEYIRIRDINNYFNKQTLKIKEGKKETCTICLDDMTNDIGIIKKCGHTYCYDCIMQWYNKANIKKCPNCNIKITINDIMLISKNDNKIISKLRNQIGSKMAYLVTYIKNVVSADDNTHMIIFSQWTETLRKIMSILESQDIKTVLCHGNKKTREKAIRLFNKDNNGYRVIMLSAEHSSSGTNLTKANKIIMVDPIYGTLQEKLDIEDQAIGRVLRINQKNEIDIVRFIIKGTIEENQHNLFYEKNKNELIKILNKAKGEIKISEDNKIKL